MIRRAAFGLLALATACSVFTDLDGFTSPPSPDGGSPDTGSGADAAGDAAPTCAPGQDFSADPKNCGACGHDCLGGACVQNTCQPVLLSAEASSAHVRVDATHLYFADPKRKGIVRMPKRGGPVESLTSAEPFMYELTIDDQFVYYQSDSGMRRVPKTGGAFEKIVAGGSLAFIAVDRGRLFWTDIAGKDENRAAIYQATADGKNVRTLVEEGRLLESLALDGDLLFYGDSEAEPGYVRVLNLATNQDSLVTSHLCRRLVVDKENIYFLEYDDPHVWKVPRTGGDAIALGESEGDVDVHDGDLAIDETSVYWAVSQPDGGLYRVAKTGGPVTTIARMDEVAGVAVDDKAVYWTIEDEPGVYMRAK